MLNEYPGRPVTFARSGGFLTGTRLRTDPYAAYTTREWVSESGNDLVSESGNDLVSESSNESVSESQEVSESVIQCVT